MFNFRDVGRTFYINADIVRIFVLASERKSISIEVCVENGVEIKGTKKRTRYSWNIEQFIKPF